MCVVSQEVTPGSIIDHRSSSIMVCWLCGFEATKLGTDAKAPMCKSNPCQICIAVTEIDEEINQAVVTLRRLMAKRCNLRSEQNRVHGTLMLRLPVELKNRIFELLLPSRDEWGEIRRTEWRAMSSYLDSISVCRGWRDIALANPFLWSTIQVNLGISNTSPNLFNDWILRSRTLPITLYVHVIDNERSRKVLANAFSQCSDRLQSLFFLVQSYTTFDALQLSNFQYHGLTQLRIYALQPHERSDQPLSLLNPTASPEKVEFTGVPFRSLQISWDRITSAKIDHFDLDDLVQLFQYASQMTFCQISSRNGRNDFSMPPIIHHKLKTLYLGLCPPPVLGSLTLPCLQELLFYNVNDLTQLPALMRRSSCPLTKLTLFYHYGSELPIDELRPLPGVTDLHVGYWDGIPQDIKRLLLEGYFPDLRHLTLRLQPFKMLWDIGGIHLLLDRKRPQADELKEGGLHKILVVDHDKVSEIARMCDSGVGEQLKALNIRMVEDGFEFL
jgi:hypothetical protein